MSADSHLTEQEVKTAMESIMTGKASDDAIEHFLITLRNKTETADEIFWAASVMRKHMLPIDGGSELLDTCGTGGDSKNTINISTISSLICAAAGAKIAKHGNRSISSSCGSADLIENLGIRIPTSPDKAKTLLDKTGFTFLFAPVFHPAVKHAISARKKIKDKTLFNILGPLCNPAGASYQLIGVYSKPLVKTLADVLIKLGIKKAMIVHAQDGTDEISLTGETHYAIADKDSVATGILTPESFGIDSKVNPAIHCKNIQEAGSMAMDILSGRPSDATDAVLINCSAALWVRGMAPDFKEGMRLAKDTVFSGAALKKLSLIREISNTL